MVVIMILNVKVIEFVKLDDALIQTMAIMTHQIGVDPGIVRLLYRKINQTVQ
jgi:hypothetical protein